MVTLRPVHKRMALPFIRDFISLPAAGEQPGPALGNGGIWAPASPSSRPVKGVQGTGQWPTGAPGPTWACQTSSVLLSCWEPGIIGLCVTVPLKVPPPLLWQIPHLQRKEALPKR